MVEHEYIAIVAVLTLIAVVVFTVINSGNRTCWQYRRQLLDNRHRLRKRELERRWECIDRAIETLKGCIDLIEQSLPAEPYPVIENEQGEKVVVGQGATWNMDTNEVKAREPVAIPKASELPEISQAQALAYQSAANFARGVIESCLKDSLNLSLADEDACRSWMQLWGDGLDEMGPRFHWARSRETGSWMPAEIVYGPRGEVWVYTPGAAMRRSASDFEFGPRLEKPA